MKNIKFIKAFTLGMISLLSLASCSDPKMSGTAVVDVTKTAGNSCIHAQISSMLGATTNLSLTIENGAYEFSKNFNADKKDASGKVDGKTFDVTYVFKGKAEKVDGKTYTLLPAETCTYDISWGMISGLYENATPTKDGKGTEKDDPTSLNYFYTPYVKNNGKNDQSMKVTFEKDTLVFEGFALT